MWAPGSGGSWIRRCIQFAPGVPKICNAGWEKGMNRRHFLGAAAAVPVLVSHRRADAAPLAGTNLADRPEVSPAKLPRWRGFNLLEKFIAENQKPFVERDFAWMAEWGFDFARLPLSYRCWADPKEWKQLREPALKEIDQ